MRIGPEYLEGTMQNLDRLLVEMASRSDRFEALASQEGGSGEKAISLDELSDETASREGGPP